MRRKLNDLKSQRTTLLEGAEALLKEGKREEYRAKMEQVTNLNADIQDLEQLVQEQDRKFLEKIPDRREEHEKALERAEILQKGMEVKFSAAETIRDVYQASKQTTLATGTIVQPTGAGGNIRDPLGNVVSSIVDEVYVQDLTGMSAYLEPYVITELDAKGGKVSTNAGTARAASTDPTFGVAKIAPYELNVTTYVDRNISRLSPANYYEKIRSMAMRAMRRKLSELIVNGDGQGSPDMFGIKNAKNLAGAEIFAKLELAGTVDENLLTELFFSYGGDETIGANARLYCNKKDLLALGKIRGSDKKRVFEITPEGGNPNRGLIKDGGTMIPYAINSFLTAHTGAEAQTQTLVYGDPMNYEVGLFGEYTIRVDESIKGVERMITILGDAMVGGNLVVDKGFVVAVTPAGG
ncbi:phage major capsid protein [Flavonifractor sp. An92]|uniref:phage major capsid protein n=1 Tax=Flavonifractor sp. An92 TaxID=1965666 RepID=UPI000B37FFEF|nr:phage major capsid protein [Flavonifractor sp. An92]OUN02284.1 phage major capsid protein [Flavonifractor sp. An92]